MRDASLPFVTGGSWSIGYNLPRHISEERSPRFASSATPAPGAEPTVAARAVDFIEGTHRLAGSTEWFHRDQAGGACTVGLEDGFGINARRVTELIDRWSHTSVPHRGARIDVGALDSPIERAATLTKVAVALGEEPAHETFACAAEDADERL